MTESSLGLMAGCRDGELQFRMKRFQVEKCYETKKDKIYSINLTQAKRGELRVETNEVWLDLVEY